MIKTVQTEDNGLQFPDMTALLDVIFILLVFLLLTANITQNVLDITLPYDDNGIAAETEQQTLTITLFKKAGHWGLENQTFDNWQAFEQALQRRLQQQPKPEIVLAGDAETSLQKMVKLFSWLGQQDISSTQILVSDGDR